MNKPMNKKRLKGSKPVVDEIEVAGKNLRDEALKYMKVRNYTKALGLYDQDRYKNVAYLKDMDSFGCCKKEFSKLRESLTPNPHYFDNV